MIYASPIPASIIFRLLFEYYPSLQYHVVRPVPEHSLQTGRASLFPAVVLTWDQYTHGSQGLCFELSFATACNCFCQFRSRW